MATGVPVPPDVLDYMDLPETLVQKWKGFIQEKMQAAQQPDPQIQLQLKKLEIDMRDQVRKEIDSYFKNMGIVAEAEAKEAGSQMQYYQSVVDQAMQQQELEQQQAQLQAQQAQAQSQMKQ